MHGFYNKLDFVSELLKSCDIVCIQEFWVGHGFISMFDKKIPDFTVLAYSGMPETELQLYGRSYGGIGLAYRNDCVKLINDSFREHILLFNVYFPCKGDPNYAAEIICAFLR